MSLVEELADQVRSASDELPIPQVTAAAERLRMASGLLAWAVRSTTEPAGRNGRGRATARAVPMPALATATAHLEHATGALLAAQQALAEYVAVLGMPGNAVPTAHRHWLVTPPTAERDGARGGWWAERIAELTGGQPGLARSVAEPAGTSAYLLLRCAAAALAGDREGFAAEFAAAGPAVGLGLAALTGRLLQRLAADLVGHPPRLEDLAPVRRAALPMVPPLLPAVPAEVPADLLATACHARPQRRRNAPQAHPVDTAAAGAVLVAALLRATGRDAGELIGVIDNARQDVAPKD
jgi:hypothetical protein